MAYYAAQCCYPSQVRPHLQRFDRAIEAAVKQYMAEEVVTEPIALRRLRLPVHKKGGGMRERGSGWYAEAAFVGAANMVVPAWSGDAVGSDIPFARGLAEQLTVEVGGGFAG